MGLQNSFSGLNLGESYDYKEVITHRKDTKSAVACEHDILSTATGGRGEGAFEQRVPPA